MTEKYKAFLPYLAAIVAFLIISFAYFPEVLQGDKLVQHDKKTWLGGANEIQEFEKQTGEHSMWTNSMFSGMPSYLVTNYAPDNYARSIYHILDLKHAYRPASFLFLALTGFFIALIFFGVNPWLALAGSVAYAFSTYFFIIIEAGHLTKVVAMAFMPPIIAGIYHAYKKHILGGTIITTLFLALQLSVNHLQITYYTMLVVFIFMIFQIIEAVKEKAYNKFIKASVFLAAGAVIAASTNFATIITTYDYGKDSIRGKSELTFNKENKTSGLDKDYATSWSYGKLETFNLLIPNLYAGGASANYENTELFETYVPIYKNYLMQQGYPARYAQKSAERAITQMFYWGPQPFTSGPVYIGAFIIFFFVLGLFVVKGKLKWWLLSATLLSFFLAWGKYFMPLTDLFLDYFPMYNKFRTVSMILIIAEFTIPLLGILAIKNIVEGKIEKKQLLKSLVYSGSILGGILLIFLANPGILSFTNPNDSKELTEVLNENRASLFKADTLRSLLFVILGIVLVFLFIKEKINQYMLYAVVGLLTITDLWLVNKRYLNTEDFQSEFEEMEPFKKTQIDDLILKDTDPNYRVLNLNVSTFNDASTSYFHKSIGGYHGAKMRRYQELIDFKIDDEIAFINQAIKPGSSDSVVRLTLSNTPTLNMLNAKYVIKDNSPIINMEALGNAWFIKNFVIVESADEEISGLINPNKIQESKALLTEKDKLMSELKDVQKEYSALIKEQAATSEIKKLENKYRDIQSKFFEVNNKIIDLTDFRPSETIVVNNQFANQVKDFKYLPDSTAYVKLTEYKPNMVKYEVNSSVEQIVSFSEVYYPKGWSVTIDGKPAEHFRANYILRAMKTPAGKHEIVFKFEPQIVKTGSTVSLIGSIIFLLFILGGTALIIKEKFFDKKEEQS